MKDSMYYSLEFKQWVPGHLNSPNRSIFEYEKLCKPYACDNCGKYMGYVDPYGYVIDYGCARCILR